MTLRDSEIRAWTVDRSVVKRIAADLATRITTGKLRRYADLPSSSDLAEEWSTTTRTVSRAKRLLFDRDLIKKTRNGSYYVP